MFKGSIYSCDVCGKEEVCKGFPELWFDVEIVRGDYAIRENVLLDIACCSQDCLRKALANYLQQVIYTSTAHN